MLSDAVLEGSGVGRFVKPQAAGRTILGLARHPRRAADRLISDAGLGWRTERQARFAA
jgi:hypothetical protein